MIPYFHPKIEHKHLSINYIILYLTFESSEFQLLFCYRRFYFIINYNQ